MRTIAQKTEEIVRQTPFLDDMLTENIVNLSALARKIKPQLEEELWKEDISLPSIVMALRRIQKKYQNLPVRLVDLSALGDITVRSNLALFTFQNTPRLIDLQKRLLDIIDEPKDTFVNFSQGLFETTIIVSEDTVPIVKKMLKNQKPSYHATNLSCITIRIPHECVKVPGYVYSVMRPLALEGINIVDITSVNKEITFIFEESEVDRAFSALKSLKQSI